MALVSVIITTKNEEADIKRGISNLSITGNVNRRFL